MHVLTFSFCGAAGLYSIHRNFTILRQQSPEAEQRSPTNHVLQVWMLLYMFVGTQTAYLLSPFVNPRPEFILFHHTGGNFCSYLWAVLREVLLR
jgi:hypothetical protein